jgi:hypothetical protein
MKGYKRKLSVLAYNYTSATQAGDSVNDEDYFSSGPIVSGVFLLSVRSRYKSSIGISD